MEHVQKLAFKSTIIKRSFKIILGIVIAVAIPFVSYANETTQDYYKSNMDIDKDDYVYFGDAEHDRYEAFGMTVTVDETSVSHDMVNLTVEMDGAMLDERSIDKFYILMNDKIVETFYPRYYTDGEGNEKMATWYAVKPSSNEFIGSEVTFQVIAIESSVYGEQYVVMWSNQTPLIFMDDLPVYDEQAVEVLIDILAKLQEMLNTLKNQVDLLEKLSKQIETMFTPSQEAEDRLDRAQQDLLKKMPMNQINNEMKQMQDTFNSTKERLSEPNSKLTFGESKDYFQIGVEVHLFDFSGIAEQIEIMRTLLSAILWIEFFMFLCFYILPSLDV